jgi:hypothetical protein
MGRIKHKIVAELMDIANRFMNGKDAYHNKRTQSPEDDRGNRYSNQRQRSRNYDNYGSHSQVAAGYKERTTKETTAGTQDIATMTEKTQAAIGNFSQEDQGNTTRHQMTCSTGHAICTMHTSSAREYHRTR